MRKLFLAILCLAIFAPAFCCAATFADREKSVVPVPPAEKGLPTEEAVAFFEITPERHTPEGAIFDNAGNLYFCDTSARRVLKLDPQKNLSVLLEVEDLAPSGLAFHKDGRLFMTALNLPDQKGAILAFDPDKDELETIIAPWAGYLPNDLVFDNKGGFYFSDFSGSATEPKGGVYYVPPDFLSIIEVAPNMAQANGIALSPDGRTLWVTEYARNKLHRINLDGETKIPPTGSKIPYTFIGPAPDSMRVDQDGNVYVAMVGQGKVMIFNANGLPIGQILLPERDLGRNLRSTSLALHPVNREARIVSGNTQEADRPEAMIFAAPTFAPGQKSNK